MSLPQDTIRRLQSGLASTALGRLLGALFGRLSPAPAITVDSGDVSITLYDAYGNRLKARMTLLMIAFDDEDADAIATLNATISAGTNGIVVEAVADKVFVVTTDENGLADFSVAGDGSVYYGLIAPDGTITVSPVVTVAP